MNLLANGMSYENKITIIVLCIAIVVFILIDLILLFSLHRNNKRLAKSRQPPTEEVKEALNSDRDVNTENNQN